MHSADSEIDKDKSISLLNKTKNPWQMIQRNPYLLRKRCLVLTEAHFEITETFFTICDPQIVQKILETENSNIRE